MGRRKPVVRYLGGLSGTGTLRCGDGDVGQAAFEFDGYDREPQGVSLCGEIRLEPAALQAVFGRPDVELVTTEGQLFHLRFSEKTLPAAAGAAHVDVVGTLPELPARWRS